MILETCCKDCVFAIYEANTQVGCEANLIDKYKNIGVQVDECYDEDKEFYVIRNKICILKRKKSGISVEQARKQIEPSFNAVVYLDEDDNHEKAQATADSLIEQELKPKNIIFAIKNDKIKFSDIHNFFGEDFVYKGIDYSISIIMKEVANVDDIVFSVSSQLKGAWVSIFHGGYKVEKEFFSSIDWALNEELKSILYIDSKDGNGVVMNAGAYHFFRSAQDGKTILQHLQENMPNTIFKKEDICRIKCASSPELTAVTQ